MHDRDDVERLGNCRRRSCLRRGGYGGFEHVHRCAAVPLLEIHPAKPPQRRETVLLVGEWVADEGLVTTGSVAPASFPLCQLCVVYEYSNSPRFHLVPRSGNILHEDARIVRRDEPSSRSFLVRVGREIPRIRAAALRLPPVRPM